MGVFQDMDYFYNTNWPLVICICAIVYAATIGWEYLKGWNHRHNHNNDYLNDGDFSCIKSYVNSMFDIDEHDNFHNITFEKYHLRSILEYTYCQYDLTLCCHNREIQCVYFADVFYAIWDLCSTNKVSDIIRAIDSVPIPNKNPDHEHIYLNPDIDDPYHIFNIDVDSLIL